MQPETILQVGYNCPKNNCRASQAHPTNQIKSGNTLISFNVPTVLFLQLFLIGSPVNAVLASRGRHALINSAFHTLQTADISVSIRLLNQFPQLVCVLLNPVLNVHLAAVSILLLAADGISQAEIIGELALQLFQLFLIKNVGSVSNSKEQPS